MSLLPLISALRPKKQESSIRLAMSQNSAANASRTVSCGTLSPPTIDPAPSTPLDTREAVCAVAHEVMGTIIDMNAPLMSAGLDSLAAVELVSTLASRLKVDIESTALFDYPTLDSLANFVSSKLAANTMVEAPT
jgi:acyl carrier protein